MTLLHQQESESPEIDAHAGTSAVATRGRRVGLALLGLLLVAVPYLVPGWLSFLVVVGIFFLVVLGLDLFLGHTGQVSLGQTLFMALGGYGGGILSLRLGVPTVVALVVMAVLSAAVAFLLGRSFLRLRGYYLALATLGLAVITENLATGLGSLTGGPSGLVGVPNIGFGSFAATTDAANYWVILILCAVGAWFVSGLVRSRTGRALAAIASDQPAASMLGVDAARYKTYAFVLAAVFASVAGTLYACYSRFISPEMVGVLVAFDLVVMLALGGSRSIVGPLLGVFLLRWLPEAGQHVALYEPLIAGVVLIVVITYLPDGIWGGIKGVVRRVGR
ncbi:MAG TPA: branched-chain amino acid ABC transporter permease [Nocardioidaceae bacterium]|nr:branched-chain amino acid ABC transporter permease [Nocardioidaceae bacterium]